ncbi:E3 ubiquitin-protein ligase CCNB1IP1 [Peziza echinospora]|nr:E3 ubiquitin-protein ligase CCNB1IP1 [Peziza echinospora]
MDGFVLRCNIIRCRALLDHRAVVTTCTHVFCPSCADNMGLLEGPGDEQRACPACRTVLSAPDDVALTILNPSDEYKTSILSGLCPSAIMEISARGIAFWNYQASQEIVYQETVSRNLNEKYTALNAQLDKLIHDANTEISNLRNKIENLSLERDGLERKCMELGDAYRDKSKKCLQVQDLYDKLKRKMFMTDVQSAATETVENMTMHMGMHQQDHGFDDSSQSQRGGHSSRLESRFGGMDNPITLDDLHPPITSGMANLRMNIGRQNRNAGAGGISSILRSSMGGDNSINSRGPRIRGGGNGGLMGIQTSHTIGEA